MSPTTRIAKVNSVIENILAEALAREIDVPGGMATVTRVETTSDLREASVWISTYASLEWDTVEATLPALQASLAGRLEMRRTPKLRLRHDEGGAHADRISQLLRNS